MSDAVNNDGVIWQSFKAGDKASFEKIYQLYFNSLFEYGVRLINNKELVKDSIHDLFVKIWTNKSNLNAVINVKSYLLVSLRGTIYNKVQKDTRVKVDEIDDSYSFILDFSVEDTFIREESFNIQSKKVMDAINSLSPRQKEAVYLRYFEELEYVEIAAMLDISVKATYKLTARALDALREIMNISNASLFILLALAKENVFV